MKKALALCALALALTLGAASAHAAALNGWAWSETFGWISFNSADSGAGGGPYAVSVDGSGDISGYAWSEYLGWISFNSGDLGGCAGSSSAHMDNNSGQVTGWAYAKVYATTPTPSQGCIELSGTGHASPVANGTGGVTFSSANGVFSGFAWGGDTGTDSGPGWIQFNTSVPVVCLAAGCGYTGHITGSCSAVPPYRNVAPGTQVTFAGSGTSGNAPYSYKWGTHSYDSETPTNQYKVTFSSTAAGPILIVKDSNGLTSESISCPTVTVLTPITASNFTIGPSFDKATLQTYTVKQTGPLALKWNFTLDEAFSCSPSIKDANGASYGNAVWNNWTGNWSSTNNNDGSETWSGDTDHNPFTRLTAGSLAAPVNPGIYKFTISCTAENQPPQTATVELKVNSSSQSEI